MKLASLLVLLLLTGCASEQVECKAIEVDGMPCQVCSHHDPSEWYASTPECHWAKAAPRKAS